MKNVEGNVAFARRDLIGGAAVGAVSALAAGSSRSAFASEGRPSDSTTYYPAVVDMSLCHRWEVSSPDEYGDYEISLLGKYAAELVFFPDGTACYFSSGGDVTWIDCKVLDGRLFIQRDGYYGWFDYDIDGEELTLLMDGGGVEMRLSRWRPAGSMVVVG